MCAKVFACSPKAKETSFGSLVDKPIAISSRNAISRNLLADIRPRECRLFDLGRKQERFTNACADVGREFIKVSFGFTIQWNENVFVFRQRCFQASARFFSIKHDVNTVIPITHHRVSIVAIRCMEEM